MNQTINQQIIISGVGGQGVLFVTRLLAEAAINKGLAVFTSETHGMAQRGGTVLSHFKVGSYTSPLIRPAQADGLLALRAENLAQHGGFLKDNGWIIANGQDDIKTEKHNWGHHWESCLYKPCKRRCNENNKGDTGSKKDY